MRRFLSIITALAFFMTVSGCAGPVVNNSTVADIFHPTTESSQVASTQATQATNSTDVASRKIVQHNRLSLKSLSQTKTDEAGIYYEYTGGDMHLTIGMTISGNIIEYGVGVYLFLDGQPQPYKLTEDGEYSYMHTFYPPDNEETALDFYFVPVTGQQGDMLHMYPCIVLYPGYYPTNPEMTNALEPGPRPGMMPQYRIQFLADPPECDAPELTDHMVATDIHYEDATSAEIGDWSAEELQTHIEYKVYVNGQETLMLTEYDPEDGLVNIRVEVWGLSSMQYGLAFLINDRLCTTNEEEYIFFEMAQGKKTVIETTLELVDYEARDGHNYISVLLIPRNFNHLLMHASCAFMPYYPITVKKAVLNIS